MKNLNKKIGVVVLSGLVIAGSGLASSASAYYEIADQYAKSKYESEWDLAPQELNSDDLEKVRQYSNILPDYWLYNVLSVQSGKNKKNKIDYGLDDRFFAEKVKKAGNKAFKSFVDADKFISHLIAVGFPKGVHRIDIRGVDYILEVIK